MLHALAPRWFDRTWRNAAVLGLIVLHPAVSSAQLTGRIDPNPPPATGPTPVTTPGTQPDRTATTAAADQPKDLYGNYYVEWRNYPKPGETTTARMTLRRYSIPL